MKEYNYPLNIDLSGRTEKRNEHFRKAVLTVLVGTLIYYGISPMVALTICIPTTMYQIFSGIEAGVKKE